QSVPRNTSCSPICPPQTGIHAQTKPAPLAWSGTSLPGLLDGGRIAVGFAADDWRSYEELLDAESEAEPGVLLTYDDDFSIAYTSGTTGVPKGIVLTHFSQQQAALGLALGFRFSFATVGILTTPLYSRGTWIVWLPTLVAGGTVVIMPKF